MKKSILGLGLVAAMLATGCSKDSLTSAYNRRDLNVPTGAFAVTYYAGQADGEMTASTTPGIADDEWNFVPTGRWAGDPSGLIASGVLTIDQGATIQFPWYPKVRTLQYHMNPEGVNSIVIEAYDDNNKLLGSNIAYLDEDNGTWNITVASNFRIVKRNGTWVTEPYQSVYKLKALPKRD